MVNIEFNLNSIKAEGHTTTESDGFEQRLVCNSVSTIMWGLVNALQHEGIEPTLDYSSGYQKVEYKGSRDTRRLFNAYSNNLRSLADEYPEYISFK